MYRITKDFAFCASHHLHGLPEDHQCARLHGHNYRVRVQLESPLLNEVGFILDYADLSPFGRWLDDTFDHRDLNETCDVENPTAENLARHFTKALRAVCSLPEEARVAVGVSETPKTWAWFDE